MGVEDILTKYLSPPPSPPKKKKLVKLLLKDIFVIGKNFTCDNGRLKLSVDVFSG